MIPVKLAQFVASVTETTVYTAPTSTTTMVKEIVAANVTNTTQTLALSVVPVGSTAGAANRILPTVPLSPNAMSIFNLSMVMTAGDFLSAVASTGAALTVTISGLEDVLLSVASGTAGVPIGGVTLHAGSTAPVSWLLCDGAAISRTAYAALFAAISTNYGVGDGSTTFNIPNIKGRVPVGRDSGDTDWDTLGETRGAKTHILVTSEMPSHGHTQNSHNHTQNSHNHGGNVTDPGFTPGVQNNATAGGGTGIYMRVGTQNALYIPADTAVNQAATATNQTTGSDGAHNNLQPSIVMNYIIRAA